MKNLKIYPIDNTPIHNKRKWIGAYVWHHGEIKRITGLNIFGNLILNRQIDVNYNSVILVKKGDFVSYNDFSILPDRCKLRTSYVIQTFLANDLILLSDVDTTNYRHLKSA